MFKENDLMPISIKMEYSAKVAKGLKNSVRKDIIQAAESSKEMLKEIRRVCQQANRRAQNVEKAGLMSPAIASLEKTGYSKFNITGMSWEQAKVEYGRAVAFLNQPTSSATGAREFEKQMRAGLGLNVDDTQWELMKHDIARDFNSHIDGILSRIPYTELMQEIYQRAEIQARNRMESDSISASENLQRQINNAADSIANQVDNSIDWLSGFHMRY